MLERIHRIKGIGLLHDADARAHGLKKASFIEINIFYKRLK